jgi:hypothetical protein
LDDFCITACIQLHFIPGKKSASNFYQKIRITLYKCTRTLFVCDFFIYIIHIARRKHLRFSPLSIPILVRTRIFFFFLWEQSSWHRRRLRFATSRYRYDLNRETPAIAFFAALVPLLVKCEFFKLSPYLVFEIRLYYRQAEHHLQFKVQTWLTNFVLLSKFFPFRNFIGKVFPIFARFFAKMQNKNCQHYFQSSFHRHCTLASYAGTVLNSAKYALQCKICNLQYTVYRPPVCQQQNSPAFFYVSKNASHDARFIYFTQP